MVQGARHEHDEALTEAAASLGLDLTVVPLRSAADVDDRLDALVLPGGESTTMRLATEAGGLLSAVFAWIAAHPGRPVLGTCAGAILLAMPGEEHAPFVEVDVARNGWGRQRASFEASVEVDLACPPPQAATVAEAHRLEGHRALPVGAPASAWSVSGAADGPMHGVFIRAPRFTSEPRRGRVVARLEGEPVGVLDGRRLALTWHPELTADRRMHRWLLAEAATAKGEA